MGTIDHKSIIKALASHTFDRLSVKRANLHIDEESKTILLPIPKNANSFLKTIFLHNARRLNFDYRTETPLQFRKRNRINYPVVTSRRILADPTYKKVIIPRSPKRRLLSCYLDKIVKKLPTQHIKINRALQKKSEEITFLDFIAYVTLIPDFQRDRHYRSQHYFAELTPIDFDFVGRVEDISSTLAYLTKERGMAICAPGNPDARKTTNYAPENSHNQKDDFTHIPAAELQRLEYFPHPDCFFNDQIDHSIQKAYEKDIIMYHRYFPSQ